MARMSAPTMTTTATIALPLFGKHILMPRSLSSLRFLCSNSSSPFVVPLHTTSKTEARTAEIDGETSSLSAGSVGPGVASANGLNRRQTGFSTS